MKIYLSDLKDVSKYPDLISCYEQKLSVVDKIRYQNITDTHRKMQFLMGRVLIYDSCKTHPTISLNGKPLVPNGYISLAHSGDFIILAVDDEPVGIDIENTQKEIPFEKLSKRLGFNINNPTKENFLRHFTAYEADFKLGEEGVKHHLFYSIDTFIICVSILNNKDNISFIKSIPFFKEEPFNILPMKEEI